MNYVLALDATLHIVTKQPTLRRDIGLLSPTLMRSQLLALLFRQVGSGLIDRNEARQRLDYMRSLKIRLLGDRVLQATAWNIADELGWPDTLEAEYPALAKLQADAMVLLDQDKAVDVSKIVRVAALEELLA